MGATMGIVGKAWNRADVDTSANVTLDLANRQLRGFTPSADLAAAKEITFVNANMAFEFRFRFTITNLAAVLTWPANVRMTDVLFNPATQEWTPIDLGEYEAHGTFDGTNWNVSIVGLWN